MLFRLTLIGALTGVCLYGCEQPQQLPQIDTNEAESQVVAAIAASDARYRKNPSPEGLTEHARLLHAHGFYDGAAQLYKKLTIQEPDDYRWPYLLALIQWQTNPDSARANFQRAADLKPRNSGFYARFGDLLLELGQTDAAKQAFEKSLALNPSQGYSVLALAKLALKEGNSDQALALTEKALAIAPHFGQAHLLASQIYRGMGDTEQARLSAEKAEQLWANIKPDDPVVNAMSELDQRANSVALRGFRSLQRGNLALAERQLSRAVELGASTQASLSLTEVYEQSGDSSQAAALFEQVLAKSPDDASANSAYASFLTRQGQNEKALRFFERSLETRGDSATTAYDYAETLVRLGRHSQAVAFLQSQRPLSHSKLNALYAWELATVSVDQGKNPALALETARQLYKKNPKDPVVLDLMAVCLAATGEFDQAVDYETQAIQQAQANGREVLVGVFSNRLRLFQQGRPYQTQAR